MFYDKKKKPGEEDMKMSPMEQDVKMNVLGGMKSGAEQDMLDKLRGLKQVSVAAKDPESLAIGLDKAKQLVSGDAESSEDPKEEHTETPAVEHLETATEGMSSEELQALIDHLTAKKGLLDQQLVKPIIAH